MKVKTYVILERAIEEGIVLGWNRAHKHTDKPSEGHLRDEILKAVMGSIDEVFDFSDETMGA